MFARVRAHVQVCSRVRVRMHACTLCGRMHACAARVCTLRGRMHACACVHVCSAGACACRHVRVCLHVRVRMHVCSCAGACVRACSGPRVPDSDIRRVSIGSLNPHWFLDFGLLYRYTASNPTTAERHTKQLSFFLFSFS